MPKLSIITINLNNAPGLKKTIESVVSQTSTDFEYIVIDGGSADESINVIKEYAGRIKYWISEPDTGIYNAMNKGILKAKGVYCQFINSGDVLVKNDVIEKMLKALPECSIFYGNMLKPLKNGIIYRVRGKEEDGLSMLTFYRSTLNHSTAFIKRSLFEKYGMYDEKLRIVSDWKFYLIVIGLHNEPVKYINIDITSFDMSGISTLNTELDKKERRRVLEEYLSPAILADYDRYWFDIEQMKRLKRYKITKFLVWIVERALFKWEKFRYRRGFKSRLISI